MKEEIEQFEFGQTTTDPYTNTHIQSVRDARDEKDTMIVAQSKIKSQHKLLIRNVYICFGLFLLATRNHVECAQSSKEQSKCLTKRNALKAVTGVFFFLILFLEIWRNQSKHFNGSQVNKYRYILSNFDELGFNKWHRGWRGRQTKRQCQQQRRRTS